MREGQSRPFGVPQGTKYFTNLQPLVPVAGRVREDFPSRRASSG